MKFPELSALYHQPLFDLISQSRAVHLELWRGEEVQRCSLLSIKTGGSRAVLIMRPLVIQPHRARGFAVLGNIRPPPTGALAGATVCMGTSLARRARWFGHLRRALWSIRGVSQLGMEVCVTLGEIGSVERANLKPLGQPTTIISTLPVLPEWRRIHFGTGSIPFADQSQHIGLLRWFGGRNRRTSCECWNLEQPRSGRRTDQLFNADAWHAVGRAISGGYL